MLRTFNCGIGMIAVSPPECAAAVMARLREEGEHPLCIGEVISASGGERVRATGRLDLG
jgi:phosphoribosylformylglycinamidine cyclo-ligase